MKIKQIRKTTQQIKKISKSNEAEEVEIKIQAKRSSKEKSIKNDNEKVASLDKKNEIENTDDINNARKKRRRSSASIE